MKQLDSCPLTTHVFQSREDSVFRTLRALTDERSSRVTQPNSDRTNRWITHRVADSDFSKRRIDISLEACETITCLVLEITRLCRLIKRRESSAASNECTMHRRGEILFSIIDVKIPMPGHTCLTLIIRLILVLQDHFRRCSVVNKTTFTVSMNLGQCKYRLKYEYVNFQRKICIHVYIYSM